MLFSYFKVAARHFTRQKRYFALNVIGLSIGLAAAMLTAFYVLHELSYDSDQPDANVHYRVVMHAQENGNEYLLSTQKHRDSC